LIAAEQNQISRAHEQIDYYYGLLRSLHQQQQTLDSLENEQNKEVAAARKSLKQREQILAVIQSRQRQEQRKLAELAETSEVLGDIVRELDLEQDTTFQQQGRELTERMKGKLYWPVEGEIVRKFGTFHNRSTGLTDKSSGIKITTQPGRKVVAALTGEVIYMGWARGLEQFVVVAHSGRLYSLYGNLDSLVISEGDQVIRGEPFAATAGELFHFEMRDGKRAVDPLLWLKQK
jgi:murein DD-endopeptidase MepM/ murein hydrolase activator NlpD